MRHDADGLFWQDIQTIAPEKPARKGAREKVTRSIPPIPDTGWKPRDFPNLEGVKQIGLDTETYDPKIFDLGPGWATGQGYVAGISIATEDAAWYFPIQHAMGENQDRASVINFVRSVAEDARTEKVFANALYDIGWLSTLDIGIAGEVRDVQIAEPLLDEHAFSYSLNALATKYLGVAKVEEDLYRWSSRAYGGKPDRSQAGNIWRCPPVLVGPYAEADASLAIQIWNKQRPLLEEADLMQLFALESALIPILFRMRRHGVRIDLEKAKQVDDALSSRIERITETLGGCNIYAATDVEKVAKKRGLWYPTTATGKPSFRSKWLEENIPEIAECRKLTKARDTFIRSYILESHVGGRIFGQFHPLRNDDSGTVSGRFSSSTPNLQNIPARDPELGPLIRSIFVPDEADAVWGSFDYSQIEYRMLVHYGTGPSAELARSQYCTDPTTDFHAFVSELTGVPRKEAKGINFGLCIAEGQRVLTHVGWVEIEKVKNWHLLWNGLKWVKHGGVICNGRKDIITYDGLTATPDHIVWDKEGYQIPLGRAASESRTLCRPPLPAGKDAIRNIDAYSGELTAGCFEPPVDRCDLLQLPATLYAPCGEHPIQGDHWMQMPSHRKAAEVFQRARKRLENLGRQVLCYAAALYNGNALLHPSLQGAGNYVGVQVSGGVYPLGARNLSGAGFQKPGFRPNRQQWSLQQGESSAGDTFREYPKRQAVVYDILDCEDGNRFVCEGVLVHNCYGMGQAALAANLGRELQDVKPLFDQYHGMFPFVKDIYNLASQRASSRGFIRTFGGRYARFPVYEPTGNHDGTEFLPYEDALAKWGPKIRRAFTHKALNRLLQGSAADLIKMAMVAIHQAGLLDAAPMLLTVHDELDFSIANTAEAQEAVEEIRRLMIGIPGLKVPLLVDAEFGPSWGEVK